MFAIFYAAITRKCLKNLELSRIICSFSSEACHLSQAEGGSSVPHDPAPLDPGSAPASIVYPKLLKLSKDSPFFNVGLGRSLQICFHFMFSVTPIPGSTHRKFIFSHLEYYFYLSTEPSRHFGGKILVRYAVRQCFSLTT